MKCPFFQEPVAMEMNPPIQQQIAFTRLSGFFSSPVRGFCQIMAAFFLPHVGGTNPKKTKVMGIQGYLDVPGS